MHSHTKGLMVRLIHFRRNHYCKNNWCVYPCGVVIHHCHRNLLNQPYKGSSFRLQPNSDRRSHILHVIFLSFFFIPHDHILLFMAYHKKAITIDKRNQFIHHVDATRCKPVPISSLIDHLFRKYQILSESFGSIRVLHSVTRCIATDPGTRANAKKCHSF